MALTVLQKLKLISDAVPDDENNLQYVDVASEFFMNSLPNYIAQKYYVPVEVTDDNGLECGTKYGHVIRDGLPCREGMAAYKHLYSNTNSQYGVNEDDPIWYKEQGKVFIKPAPTSTEKGYVASIPRNFISDYTASGLQAIPNTPANAEHIILLYAAFLILQKNMRSINDSYPTFPNTFDDTANNLSISFPTLPTISIDTSLNFTALDSLSMNSNSIGDYSIDSAEIAKAFKALDNAYEFIGSLETNVGTFNPNDESDDADNVPKGAFWLDDEDPEMVDSAVRLAAQEVNRANGYFQNQGQGLQSFATAVNASATEYQAKVNKELQKISSQIQSINSTISSKSLELQKHNLSISEVQTELQKFQADVSQRLQKNNQILQRYSTQVQSFQQEYSFIIQEIQLIFQQYTQEYSKFLGAHGSQ